MANSESRIKLHGFNNLTKMLSFNIYDVCYAATAQHTADYIDYIDEAYNAERLTQILTDVANIIGANILNVARQDYDPQGASVTMLISEEPIHKAQVLGHSLGEGHRPIPEIMLAHLDKSHITVHTYPERHPHNNIATFRADIDVATCGIISPLKALNYLIHALESDIVTVDYRVRGFTRDVSGRKHFIDHKINSIQNSISKETRERYQMIDVNMFQENIFHTKMILKNFNLDDYLFGVKESALNPKEGLRIRKLLQHEMMEMFYGRNIRRVD